MHLRTLNPHVAAVMAAAPGALALPRQPSALADNQLHLNTGISSFAFQGTNAHAVLQASATSGEAWPAVAAVPWQQRREWVLPSAHCLIKQHLPQMPPSKATFACSLQQPALAFLWDHEVMGRSLFPGAGYFDMALAGLHTLHSSAAVTTAIICLTQAVIPTPLVLPASSTADHVTLTCSVDFSTQAISIASAAGHASQTVHMRGQAAQAHRVPTTAGESLTVTAVQALMALLTLEVPLNESTLPEAQAAAQALVASAATTAQQDSGFWHHPARFDSFLQMGQLFLDSKPGSIHVPAGVDCLSITGKMDAAHSMYGSCQPSGVALNSNYALADQQASNCCQMQGMQAKVMSTGRSSTAGATGEAIESQEASVEVLYEMAWLADHQSMAEPEVDSCIAARMSINLQTPAMACAHALAVLQDCMTNALDSHATLQGSSEVAGSNSSTLQVLAGVFRTAAVETNASLSVQEDSPFQGEPIHCASLHTPLVGILCYLFGKQWHVRVNHTLSSCHCLGDCNSITMDKNLIQQVCIIAVAS